MIAHIAKYFDRLLAPHFGLAGGELHYDRTVEAVDHEFLEQLNAIALLIPAVSAEQSPIVKDKNVTETPLVFIDTETTGTHPERLPWEIAMIRREDGIDSRIVIQISDVDLSHAEPKGLEVGGFYKRHRAYAPKSEWKDGVMFYRENLAARVVEKWTRDAHLIGVNPAFDDQTLDAMLRRHNLIPAWHYHVIDVSAMGLGYLRGYADHSRKYGPFDPTQPENTIAPPYKSDQIAAACGVRPLPDHLRHTALGDATWAMEWYDTIMRGAATACSDTSSPTVETDIAMVAEAAGVKPGKDLIRYLGLIAYVSAETGAPRQSIAKIFNQVQAKGIAYTIDVNQLAVFGLPIWQWLMIETNWNISARDEAVAAGKLDANTFLSAIENNLGSLLAASKNEGSNE